MTYIDTIGGLVRRSAFALVLSATVACGDSDSDVATDSGSSSGGASTSTSSEGGSTVTSEGSSTTDPGTTTGVDPACEGVTLGPGVNTCCCFAQRDDRCEILVLNEACATDLVCPVLEIAVTPEFEPPMPPQFDMAILQCVTDALVARTPGRLIWRTDDGAAGRHVWEVTIVGEQAYVLETDELDLAATTNASLRSVRDPADYAPCDEAECLLTEPFGPVAEVCAEIVDGYIGVCS